MTVADDSLFVLAPLSKDHDRAGFSCGVESLDQYIKTQASQDMRRKANAVFVLSPKESPATIAGYFTLCALGLEPGSIPEAARKCLPRYPMVSATLLGRLAIATAFQGCGIGRLLLSEALSKAYENAAQVGSSVVVVDAIDEGAVNFYQRNGFVRLANSMRLIVPMQTIAGLIAK